MSKSHVGKNDISKYSYRKKDCDKKHHTLLHEDKKANINKSSRNKLQIQNAVTYLQVLPVIVTNRSNHVKTSSQLYTVSGSTLITLELDNQILKAPVRSRKYQTLYPHSKQYSQNL